MSGHARLLKPASRSSAWREGFNTPRRNDDNGAWCGGMTYQHRQAGGKCAICGDAYNDPVPRRMEAPGRMATGTITGEYREGQTIKITVHVTANHKGVFVFKLCHFGNRSCRH